MKLLSQADVGGGKEEEKEEEGGKHAGKSKQKGGGAAVRAACTILEVAFDVKTVSAGDNGAESTSEKARKHTPV